MFKKHSLIGSGDSWVFITGASGGLGSEFAFQLASKGYNLFLTSEDKFSSELNFIKGRLESKFGVSVKTFLADLSDDKAVSRLLSAVKKLPSLKMIINSAGFGIGDYFEDSDLDLMIKMVKVHDEVPLKIISGLLPLLKRNKSSFIINISSFSAFFPFKRSSVYSASKSFLVSFSRSLHFELQKEGLTVQVLCPGPVKTNFFKESKSPLGNNAYFFIKKLTPGFVVRKSLNCLGKKLICIPGFYYKFLFFLSKIIPSSFINSFIK